MDTNTLAFPLNWVVLSCISADSSGGLSTLAADISKAISLSSICEALLASYMCPLWTGLNDPERIPPENLAA